MFRHLLGKKPKDPHAEPIGEAGHCWWCERTWAEASTEEGERDRANFQDDCGTDRAKQVKFLERRTKLIDRKLKLKVDPKASKRKGSSARL